MPSLVVDLQWAIDPAIWTMDNFDLDLDPWQIEALRWSGQRQLLNCSRQSGKSTIAALLGLHKAQYTPRSLTLLFSVGLRQARELFLKVTEFRTALRPIPILTEDNKAACTLVNGSRIVSLPSSESTIRGYSGVDLLIEDESSRVLDEVYYATRPMLAVSGGRHLLLSTPFGKRGHFFEVWDGKNDWTKIEINADQCPRITAEFLKEERDALGDWWFFQEYYCVFNDAISAVFSYDEVMDAFTDEVQPFFAPKEPAECIP